jgi:hypothetical protein
MFAIVGCGSSAGHTPDAMQVALSGIESSRALSELGPDEVMQLCTWEVATLGGAGFTRSCSSCDGNACTDWDVTVYSLDQCVSQVRELAACGITVGADEACTVDQAADLCAGPVSCRPLDACL